MRIKEVRGGDESQLELKIDSLRYICPNITEWASSACECLFCLCFLICLVSHPPAPPHPLVSH